MCIYICVFPTAYSVFCKTAALNGVCRESLAHLAKEGPSTSTPPAQQEFYMIIHPTIILDK